MSNQILVVNMLFVLDLGPILPQQFKLITSLLMRIINNVVDKRFKSSKTILQTKFKTIRA